LFGLDAVGLAGVLKVSADVKVSKAGCLNGLLRVADGKLSGRIFFATFDDLLNVDDDLLNADDTPSKSAMYSPSQFLYKYSYIYKNKQEQIIAMGFWVL